MGFAQVNAVPLNGKKTVLFHGTDTWVVNTVSHKVEKATPAELADIAKDRNKYENYGVSDAQLQAFKDEEAGKSLPAPTNVKVTPTAMDAVAVTWDSAIELDAKYFVVRWGINGDGLLDNNLVGATTKNATVDMTTAAGETVDVYVAQFKKTYTTPALALESAEYNALTAWSPLVTAQIPN